MMDATDRPTTYCARCGEFAAVKDTTMSGDRWVRRWVHVSETGATIFRTHPAEGPICEWEDLTPDGIMDPCGADAGQERDSVPMCDRHARTYDRSVR